MRLPDVIKTEPRMHFTGRDLPGPDAATADIKQRVFLRSFLWGVQPDESLTFVAGASESWLQLYRRVCYQRQEASA